MTLQARETKVKLNYWDYTKIKSEGNQQNKKATY